MSAQPGREAGEGGWWPIARADVVPALWTVLSGFNASTDVHVHLRSSRWWPRPMAATTAAGLTAIVEEALSDVSRRGGASRVEVELETEGDDLVLGVRDDGQPEPSWGGWAPHRGFDRLRERAAGIGGRVAVASGARDTVVRVVVPRS